MRDLSDQAGEQILASRGRFFHGPERPPPGPLMQLQARNSGDIAISPGFAHHAGAGPLLALKTPQTTSHFLLQTIGHAGNPSCRMLCHPYASSPDRGTTGECSNWDTESLR
jgi:hypothetical protein